ncbi:hypothetical protein FSP39_016927 [Pinctada imbricata]|uniref:Integrase catalytic domain-containing protein n=1 Tax=Pinctada imbricata TaxID=66713 RepID=A0AA89C433_PINIB|nr:hypothetical protein FSP39_016927 [Pinctada imbricata]
METKNHPTYKEVALLGHFKKSIWSQWEKLIISDGVLYRRYTDDGNKETLQAVIPNSERRTVLTQYHDCKTSAHLGVTKTLNKIRQHYFWPVMQSDVRTYIAGCDKCSRKKEFQQKRRAPMQIVQSHAPMEHIATDILCELPSTSAGNKYIFVVSDYYTKWTESFPMPNIESETVAKFIVEEVITRFGVPSIIHSDQGSQYKSKLFSDVCELLGIQKIHTTPYHPQSDGMVERFNKTLCNMLSAYVQDNHRDWDTHLPYVMMVYRSAMQETTGCTPNRLMLVREVTTPLYITYGLPSTSKRIPSNQWAWHLQEQMEDKHKFVNAHVQGEMKRQTLGWMKFKKGDRVYVFFPQRKAGTSSKLTSYWNYPFDITRKVSDFLYKVNCGYRGKPQTIHVDRLRLVKSQVLRGESASGDKSETHSTLEVDLPSVTRQREDKSVRSRRAPVWLDDYYRY